MNNDLIRRGELLEKITKAQNMLRTSSDALWEINQKYFKGLAWANRLVLDEPAVDAVEVVRCRDCRHTREKDEYEKNYLVEGVLICTSQDATDDCSHAVWPDHFCSYGERREDNG